MPLNRVEVHPKDHFVFLSGFCATYLRRSSTSACSVNMFNLISTCRPFNTEQTKSFTGNELSIDFWHFTYRGYLTELNTWLKQDSKNDFCFLLKLALQKLNGNYIYCHIKGFSLHIEGQWCGITFITKWYSTR